jgi:hypothetical protein
MTSKINIAKHLKKISFKDSGDAFWSALGIIPILDNQIDDEEKHVILTQIPKYLGQFREVGKSAAIDEGFRPFPKLNAKDWPEIYSYVSSAWDLSTQNEDGSITILEVELSGDRKEQKLIKTIDKRINNFQTFFEDLAKKCDQIETERGTFVLEGSIELTEEYLSHYVDQIFLHFEGQKERSELLIGACMLLMLADGDNIGAEKLYLQLLVAKFKFKSQFAEFSIAEKFNSFIIPTVVEIHHSFSKFDDFSSEKLVKNLSEKNYHAALSYLVSFFEIERDIEEDEQDWICQTFGSIKAYEEVEENIETIKADLINGLDLNEMVEQGKSLPKNLLFEINKLILTITPPEILANCLTRKSNRRNKDGVYTYTIEDQLAIILMTSTSKNIDLDKLWKQSTGNSKGEWLDDIYDAYN